MTQATINNPAIITLSTLASRACDNSGQMFSLPTTERLTRSMGYVTSDRKVKVVLWNGSGSEVTLSAINISGDSDGISWDATPPDVLPTLTSQEVVLTVAIDGPLAFVATLQFISACALAPIFTLTGTRAPQISGDVGYLFFPHNWEDGLDESLAWKTDVLIAHDRTEQRVQLRTMPRRQWQWRLLVGGAGRRKLEAWLGLRKTRQICSPVWRDVGRTTASIASGSSLVPVDTAYLDYAVGRHIAVFTSWQDFEVRVVSGIGPGFVAADAPFNRDWPEGAMVAPCRFGVCLQQRSITRWTEDVAEYQVAFEALGESLMPAMAAPDSYRSVDVCPMTPTVVFDAEESWDNKWVRLDNDTGVLEYDIQSIEPVFSREATFLVIGRAKIDEMLRFLFACAGRLAPFWLAGNDRCFELAAPVPQDATTVVIEPIDYDFALEGSPSREHIELITTDGTVIRRKITAIATLPSGLEQWTLDSGLPMAIEAATLNRCAWLELVRLQSDEVSLHWVAWDCVELTLPVVALP